MKKSPPARQLVPLLAVAALSAACAATEGAVAVVAPPPTAAHPGETGRIADGDRVTPFDVQVPAVGRLDPVLLTAIQAAAREARDDGVSLLVTSGWRSADYQRQLLEDAVSVYGSLDAARRLVSTPELSRHVAGTAVDIGPTAAADWMIRYGAAHGLCQVYVNEMWHFELVGSPDGGCPEQLPDASAG
ncbi:M15 family metallopeptidase [Rhodococcus tukisamuensis]|nr:M15 family metallopeptidase [Rhodococcus tukisamuensis]